MRFFLPVILALGVGACAGDQAPTKPQLSSQPECLTTPDSTGCKFRHDLAGGYPFTLDMGL